MSDLNTQSAMAVARQRVLEHWPVVKWNSAVTVAAVSAGPDSVALLHVLHELYAEYASTNQLVVAHVNHRTQGHRSDADAQFVERLADQLDLVCRVSVLAPQPALRPSERSLRDRTCASDA